MADSNQAVIPPNCVSKFLELKIAALLVLVLKFAEKRGSERIVLRIGGERDLGWQLAIFESGIRVRLLRWRPDIEPETRSLVRALAIRVRVVTGIRKWTWRLGMLLTVTGLGFQCLILGLGGSLNLRRRCVLVCQPGNLVSTQAVSLELSFLLG